MKKIFFNIILVVCVVMMCFACKKKPKHKWIEVGSDPNPAPVAPGIHPERGVAGDAVDIVIAPVYIPIGRDKNGDPQYKKDMYELEVLTPEALDEALKQLGIIDEASLFCDLVIEDSGETISAGPGSDGGVLKDKGTVRYVDLSTSMDNSDEYADKTRAKDLEGMIDYDDIMYCITQTFEENFHLVSCDIEPVGMEVYNEVHKN